MFHFRDNVCLKKDTIPVMMTLQHTLIHTSESDVLRDVSYEEFSKADTFLLHTIIV